MTLLAVAIFVLVSFVALPIADYRHDRSPDRREQAVTTMLQPTRLQVDDQTRSILRERLA